MGRLLLIILAAFFAGHSTVWASATRTSDVYHLALQYKKKGMWQQALPLMRQLASQGHIPAKTDLATMLLPIRDRGKAHDLTRLSFTNEQTALILLDEAIESSYSPAMVVSADWHTDHAAYRCEGLACRKEHLAQAKQLHQKAAYLGEHQSFAWLAYFYNTFCKGEPSRAVENKRRAIDLYRRKRPRADAQIAGHWFKTYAAFADDLQKINLQDPDSVCR